MKKTLIVLLALLMTVGLCIAQTTEMEGYFTRSGMATQELQTDGLTAAHPTFPIGTKIRITNVSNGADIEATIVGQIPLSGDRIIDLSRGSAHGLGFQTGDGGPVVITAYTLPSRAIQSSPPASAPPEFVAISPPNPPENPENPLGNFNTNTSTNSNVRTQVEKETLEKTEKAALPFNITINNYLTNTNTNTSPQDRQQERPTRKGKDTKPPAAPPPPASQPPSAVADTPPAYQPPQPSSQPPAYQPPAYQPTASSLITAPPVADVQIIPALPNPHSDKTYRLLVGNYDNTENAYGIQQQLQAVGFDVEQEQMGDWCKVYASGIPAASVYYAAKRLGAIGFAQVWVYE